MAMDRTEQYGPVFGPLVADERLCTLGPGTPNRLSRPRLDAMTVESAFAGRTVHDRSMALACCAGVWLYHDYLDESHRISQTIDTPTGSYWHGLMHRREPDYSNSKYWFRRVGVHPVFAELAAAAAGLAATHPPSPAAAFLKHAASWEPFAFIDLCEACVEGRAPDELLCRRIQQREWELLFDFCYRKAVGDH